jgi:hypothetical protein
MKLFIRRLRGMIGMGVTWAVPWGIVGGLISVVQILLAVGTNPAPARVALQVFLTIGAFWAVWGFVWGVAFVALLSKVERNGTLETLKMRRVAAWGAIAGALPGLILVVAFFTARQVGSLADYAFVAATSSLGAAFAAISLKLARWRPGSEAEADAENMTNAAVLLPGEPIGAQAFRKQRETQKAG